MKPSTKAKHTRIMPRAQDVETPAIPAALAHAFLNPALLSYERKGEYFDLVEALSSAINPRDTVEWLWLKDLVDLTWDLNRLKRVQVALLRSERTKAARAALGARKDKAEDDDWSWLEKYKYERVHRRALEPAVLILVDGGEAEGPHRL